MPSELERFNERMQAFFAPLWPGEEKPLVLGEGCGDRPPVMLIGEAPGEQEAMSGRPFVGKAGKNLDGFLTVLQLNREDIYISNVVKIRPTKVSEKGRGSFFFIKVSDQHNGTVIHRCPHAKTLHQPSGSSCNLEVGITSKICLDRIDNYQPRPEFYNSLPDALIIQSQAAVCFFIYEGHIPAICPTFFKPGLNGI